MPNVGDVLRAHLADAEAALEIEKAEAEEYHKEARRLRLIIRRIEIRTRADDTLEQRLIGVRVLCKEALGWGDAGQMTDKEGES